MSIIIDTITLDNHMDWIDEFDWVPSVGASARTLEGVGVSQAYSIYGDRPFTLQGEATRGWQTRLTVEYLKALASTPGLTFTVNYEGDSYTARFAHEDAPTIVFRPVTPVDDPDDAFWYTGTIKMRVI